MQIIIDTDKESKDNLKKLSRFLRDLSGEEVSYEDSYKNSKTQTFEPAESEGIFNMFGESSKEDTTNKEPFYEDEPKKEEKDEPKIQIIEW